MSHLTISKMSFFFHIYITANIRARVQNVISSTRRETNRNRKSPSEERTHNSNVKDIKISSLFCFLIFFIYAPSIIF